ncbi:hypothetical protein M885DRAFT_524653 [Pelagophyceae sp. CCMP2097]|nr:hypothetical protein M885DRAFT_524653 [Pelagophyceae sp. CCMP2097]|mmetsp:Transcript_20469/g.70681  ORF Transcript_20469/g.70681 Transcript_20469/m.70681 type:complete len:1183 (+) Transcript_20469:169-3717(+)
MEDRLDERVIEDCDAVREEKKYRLLPHFLQLRGLMRQHIASFDFFVNHDIKKVVGASLNKTVRSEVDPNFFLEYTDVNVGTPTIDEDAFTSNVATPMECRLRDSTYSAPIMVDVRYRRGMQVVTTKDVVIGRIPIMLRSSKCVLRDKTKAELESLKECSLDPGGYFVVKGQEKVVLMQEQLSKNRVIIETDIKGHVCAAITSSTHERKSRCSIYAKQTPRGPRVYMKHNTLGDELPIVILLKAMGMESDQEIAELVGHGNKKIMDLFILSFEEPAASHVRTQKQALEYIGAAIREKQKANESSSNVYSQARRPASAEDEAREVLAGVVLSHVPVVDYDFVAKRVFIGYVTRKVLAAFIDRSLLDDKDYYGNKRLELAGQLLSLLFEDLFKRFNADLKRSADLVLQKQNRTTVFDIVKSTVWRTDTITQGFVHAISSGNWVLKRFKMDRAGVTQILSRLSYMSAVGMMTRVNSQFEKTRKTSGPRALQPSQWGMLCPADTPEGETCGLVKNLALLAHVTTDADQEPIKELCFDLGVEQLGHLGAGDLNSYHLVFLNGLVIGACKRPLKLSAALRSLRRQSKIPEFVSVYTHPTERAVYVACDGGRVCRPLAIAPNGVSRLVTGLVDLVATGRMPLTALLKSGVVEYVDVNESNNCLVALDETLLTPEHTHVEIDPVTVLGVVSGLVAFPHHNQSPRNTYQCAMGKQAMGAIATNQYERMDGLLYSLVYPQKPMVKSRVLDLVSFDDLPGGCNATLAVMSYSGYDIEDAIVMNRASLDRGFMRCMVHKKHQASIRRYANGTSDRTTGPPPADSFHGGVEDARYKRFVALDLDGICRVGEKLEDQSIMINKEVPKADDTAAAMAAGGNKPATGRGGTKAKPAVEYKGQPISYKSPCPAYVDRVLLTANDVDQFLVKVIVRQVRRPEVGDKFASRHGQKGVVGAIVPQEDMPFSDAGICPDLIMNPHGFPSRMTVGKIIELVVGKAGVFQGRQARCTAFGEPFGSADRVHIASKALLHYGYSYVGKDLLYSGISGAPLLTYIFMGPVFYQKLKHMVLDKMHARARGPRAQLTRQPTEGRSRDGGLRLGEMERDCLIAYGAANLLTERLMISSDQFTVHVCEHCGLLGYSTLQDTDESGRGGHSTSWCQNCRTNEHMACIQIPYACKLLFQELQSMNVAPRLKLEDK